jgi:hypothetical protein
MAKAALLASGKGSNNSVSDLSAVISFENNFTKDIQFEVDNNCPVCIFLGCPFPIPVVDDIFIFAFDTWNCHEIICPT